MKQIKALTERFPELESIQASLERAAEMIEETYRAGAKLLLCGNGGSAADCDHIVGELMKGFLLRRSLKGTDVSKFAGLCEDPAAFANGLQGGLPAISLVSATALNSAFCNDVEPDMIYAQGVWGLGCPGDLLIAISTSGNSKNVVNAAIAARAKGMAVLALTGEKESRLSALSTLTLQAPAHETYRIQEYHLPIYHALCAAVEERIFGGDEV